MGAVAIDLNNVVELNATGFRALSDALGDDGARVFINQFRERGPRPDEWKNERPKISATQIADALERGKARSAAMNASVGGGRGNFTEDRHNFPGMTHEEISAGIKEIQAAMRS